MKVLVAIEFIFILHVILLSKLTPKYLHDLRKKFPSIHCKMRLNWLSSMGEVDDWILLFTGFYVPSLTPRIYCREDAFQLPENITFIVVCLI